MATKKPVVSRKKAAEAAAAEEVGQALAVSAPQRSRQEIDDDYYRGMDLADLGSSKAPESLPEPVIDPVVGAAESVGAAEVGPSRRIGANLTEQEFKDAKAAYVADWRAGGTADTFGRWVTDAIVIHAALSAAKRAALASQVSGRTARSWPIPETVIAQMQASIERDQIEEGRWPTAGAWVADAVLAAVAAAVKRDGTLPQVPPRLPAKMPRRSEK